MSRRRTDPYAILQEPGRRSHPLLALLAPLVVVALVVGLMAYVVAPGSDDLPAAPPGQNAPRQP